MKSIAVLFRITCLALCCSLSFAPESQADDAMSIFQPSYADMLKAAAAIAEARDNLNAAEGCAADPMCESPGDTSSGFETSLGACCYEIDDCFNEFNEYVRKTDVALYTLYKNERTYTIFMMAQNARIAMMKGAASTSAAGTAIGGKLEADVAKAKKSYVDKFNVTTNANVNRLNEFLLGLDSTLKQYCAVDNWYQINGLPIFIHAKTKFPK